MIEFPEKDLNLLLACNGANNWTMKQKFYSLKATILNKHGSFDEYDLQILQKKCDRCDGKGCDVCVNGIYNVNKIALKRYLVNEYVFHIPVGRITEKGDIEVFGIENKTLKLIEHRIVYRNNIQGIINHKPTDSNLNYTFAFFILCFKYDKNRFYDEIGDYSSRLYAKQKGKYRSALRNNDLMMDGLSEHFGITEQTEKEKYNIDEMLFKNNNQETNDTE